MRGEWRAATPGEGPLGALPGGPVLPPRELPGVRLGSLSGVLTPSLTLIGKPDCHLCSEARQVVTQVVDGLAAEGVPVAFEEHSILDDADLDVRWHDDIPVVLIGTALHDRWHVDPERLRADLLAAADL